MNQGLLFPSEPGKPTLAQEPVLEPIRTPSIRGYVIDAYGRFRCHPCNARSGASRCIECRPLRARLKRLAASVSEGQKKATDLFQQARADQTWAMVWQIALRTAEMDTSGIDQVVAENAEILASVAPHQDSLFALRIVSAGEHVYTVRRYSPIGNRKGNWVWGTSVEVVGLLWGNPISESLGRRISHLTGIGMGGMANARITPGELYLLGLGPPPPGLLEVDWRPNGMLPEDYSA